MMPAIEMKPKIDNGNEIQTVINRFITKMDATLNDENSHALKNTTDIKTENGNFCLERENSSDNSQSTCMRCQNLQKRLKVSRGWNRFFREKLLNTDKLLHIIEEYENEKKKNIELQLAYDQRSREWAHQQEQLITLYHEMQPLREKLRIAEESATEEKKLRLKHQYMEDSLKVTIQQLQAKVSHMNTIANPVFVENLEKKLSTARSENKKVKCNLEFKKMEVEELRSYISNKHTQVENLSKKLLWALQLANKYGAEESSNKESTPEWDILQIQTHNILHSLKAQFDSFCTTKKRELKGRRLELACLPSFPKWVIDFESHNTSGRDSPEKSSQSEVKKSSDPAEIEEEASQLEKLLSGVNVEEVFASMNRAELKDSMDLTLPVPKSPSKSDSSNGKKSSNLKKEIEDNGKNNNLENPATKIVNKTSKASRTKSSNKADSERNKKTMNDGKPPADEKVEFQSESSIAKQTNKGSYRSPRNKRLNSSVSERSRSSETSIFSSPVHDMPRKGLSTSSNFAITKSISKSPRKRRRSSRSDSDGSPVKKSEPSVKDNFDMFKNIMNRSLEISNSRLSSTPVKKKLSPRKNSVTPSPLKKRRKTVVDDLILSSDTDSDDIPLSNIKKSMSPNNSSNSGVRDGSPISPMLNKNEVDRLSDLERIKKIIDAFTVPPLNFSSYLEDTDSSSEVGVRLAPKKPIVVRREKPKRKVHIPAINENSSFVPQRVTRSSYKRKDVTDDSVKSSSAVENKEEVAPSTSAKKRVKSVLSSDTESSSRDSPFIPPSPVRWRRKGSNNQILLETTKTNEDLIESSTSQVTKLHRTLKSDLSISSSYTDTEESEIEISKTELASTVISSEVIDKSCHVDEASNEPIALNKGKNMETAILHETFINDIDLAPSREEREGPAPSNKIDMEVPDLEFEAQEPADMALLGLNLSEDSIQDEDEDQLNSITDSILSLSQICNENDSLKIISPISSPIKIDSQSCSSNVCESGISLDPVPDESDLTNKPSANDGEVQTSLNPLNVDSLYINEAAAYSIKGEEIFSDICRAKSEKMASNASQMEIDEVTGDVSMREIDVIISKAHKEVNGIENDVPQVETEDLSSIVPEVETEGIESVILQVKIERIKSDMPLVETEAIASYAPYVEPEGLVDDDPEAEITGLVNDVPQMETEGVGSEVPQVETEGIVSDVPQMEIKGIISNVHKVEFEEISYVLQAESEELINDVPQVETEGMVSDVPQMETKGIISNVHKVEFEEISYVLQAESEKLINDVPQVETEGMVSDVPQMETKGIISNVHKIEFEEISYVLQAESEELINDVPQVETEGMVSDVPQMETKGIISNVHKIEFEEISYVLQAESEELINDVPQVETERMVSDVPQMETKGIISNVHKVEFEEISYVLQAESEELINDVPQVETEGMVSDVPQMETKGIISNVHKVEFEEISYVLQAESEKLINDVPQVETERILSDVSLETKSKFDVTKEMLNDEAAIESFNENAKVEKCTPSKVLSKLNSLFADDQILQISVSPIRSVSKRRDSASSDVSQVLSDSSDNELELKSNVNGNIVVNNDNVESKAEMSTDEEENLLIMDIDEVIPSRLDSKEVKDSPHLTDSDDDNNTVERVTDKSSALVIEEKETLKSPQSIHINPDQQVSMEIPEAEVNPVDLDTSVLPSFYKERRDVSEQNGYHVPKIFFEEAPLEESVNTNEPQKKNKAKKRKEERAQSEQSKTKEAIVEQACCEDPSLWLPQIRSHSAFQDTPSKLEDNEMNCKELRECFEDIIGCHFRSHEWNNLINKICNRLENTKAPDLISKLQPLVKVLLISVLRSSPFEKRETNFSVPPTIYKLFQIVRIIELKFRFPPFTIDSLVNVAAHKLILTKRLRPNSLASLTTWVISSCYAQYNKLESPLDEECVRWGRGFLTDLLFHHKGLVHESLLAAINSSKKIFVRIVKYRESTALEKLIFWIAHHGSWTGPKTTKTQLLDSFKLKLGLHNPPPEFSVRLLRSILEVLFDVEANADELASTDTGFNLLLMWVPSSWITKAIFPLLKEVYYDGVISSKLSLEDVKELLACKVNKAQWSEEDEAQFLDALKSFPIIKS